MCDRLTQPERVLEGVLQRVGRIVQRRAHPDEPPVDRGVYGLATGEPLLSRLGVEGRIGSASECHIHS